MRLSRVPGPPIEGEGFQGMVSGRSLQPTTRTSRVPEGESGSEGNHSWDRSKAGIHGEANTEQPACKWELVRNNQSGAGGLIQGWLCPEVRNMRAGGGGEAAPGQAGEGLCMLGFKDRKGCRLEVQARRAELTQEAQGMIQRADTRFGAGAGAEASGRVALVR